MVAETRAEVLDLAARAKFAKDGERLTESRSLMAELLQGIEEPAAPRDQMLGMAVQLEGLPANVSPAVRRKTEGMVEKAVFDLFDVG
jgi:molybdopterin-biosynthesis enzyme MoeA-like protein